MSWKESIEFETKKHPKWIASLNKIQDLQKNYNNSSIFSTRQTPKNRITIKTCYRIRTNSLRTYIRGMRKYHQNTIESK